MTIEMQEAPVSEMPAHFVPEPVTVEESGLDIGSLADLALKALYYSGQTTAGQLGATLALSQPVTQDVLAFLTRDRLCEVTGSEGHGPASYRYSMSGRGTERTAASALRAGYRPVTTRPGLAPGVFVS